MAAIHWLSVEPRTGKIIDELPGLQTTSSLPTMIGRANTATVSLPITDRLPRQWDVATAPGRATLVACWDDPDETVLWHGWVSRRSYGSGASIDLSLTDVNGWLEGARRVPSRTFVETEQTAIMRWLGLDALADQFHGEVVEIPSGVVRDRTYADDEDKTKLDAMRQLMSVIDGCEWKTDFRWDSGRLVTVPTTAQKVGRRALVGQSKPVLSDVEWTLTEDYGEGAGAAVVTAVAIREGDERLAVTVQDDLLIDAGWVVQEHRWSPDTGSTSEPLIRSYATKKLADIARGTGSYAVTVNVAGASQLLGRDMGLGDDIEIDIRNPDMQEWTATIPGRLIGWVAEPDPESGEIVSVSPVLYQDEVV